MPRTKRFWKARKTATTGIIDTSVIAIISSHGWEKVPRMVLADSTPESTDFSFRFQDWEG